MAVAFDAVVVGSGPNGLAAAVACARAGLAVLVLEGQATGGGGSRTLDLGLAPGLVHDVCSAVHPLAALSPFLREFDLAARGVASTAPEVSYAHPLDGAPAALAWRGLDRACAGLGSDGEAWRVLFGRLAGHAPEAAALALGDKRSLPPELGYSPGAGLRTAASLAATATAAGTPALGAVLRTRAARALLTGVAAHTIARLPSLAGGGTAALLGAAAHGPGWPIVHGGSQAIADALLADLAAHGGSLELGSPVASRADLPPALAYLFDTSADAAVGILGDALPPRVRRGLGRLGHGAAAAKVDFVLNGPVPWADPQVARAGTVHLGGDAADLRANAARVAAGRLPELPTTLVSDPATFDAGRQVGGLRPLWAYAHVPFGCPADVTERVSAQLERFAPGFRDLVVAARCVPADRMADHNANLVGGDIAAGTVDAWRLVARPRAALDPYALGVPGMYLCSAATPPGPGVHGMGGWFAARRALAQRFGIARPPALGPHPTAPAR